MNSSSRAPAPAPIDIGHMKSDLNSPTNSFASDDFTMNMPSAFHDRKASQGSMEPMKRVKSPKANAHSYCGRHSDEFLFGGHGFGDLWRSITKKEH
ncbi:hypothetical protein B0T25DRAFT_143650 [Lasiosphaeria hispida]|uniref:Uncharacterized protein n=1 Tax=Lasiosphaeria hispida TaxID=260671 RepID=A0AAJ0HLK3_9PEZI|nr:hypothetical protein B0T25DRAFT_143650 [Lasiosphaeria hispida]